MDIMKLLSILVIGSCTSNSLSLRLKDMHIVKFATSLFAPKFCTFADIPMRPKFSHPGPVLKLLQFFASSDLIYNRCNHFQHIAQKRSGMNWIWSPKA